MSCKVTSIHHSSVARPYAFVYPSERDLCYMWAESIMGCDMEKLWPGQIFAASLPPSYCMAYVYMHGSWMRAARLRLLSPSQVFDMANNTLWRISAAVAEHAAMAEPAAQVDIVEAKRDGAATAGVGALFGDGDDEAKVCCDHSISGVLEQPQL